MKTNRGKGPRKADSPQGPDWRFPSFRPAWFCPGADLQSLWGYLSRYRFSIPWRRERWDTPDGDFLDIDFLDAQSPESPTLLCVHGLEGSSRSHYMKGIARAAAARGWRSVALNFRSCGGEPNRLPRFYHSGETGDIGFAARRLAERFEGPLLLAGFSLGGNVLLKWLGECGEALPEKVRGAVAISTSFAPGESATAIDSARGFIYRRHLLASCKRKGLALARRHPGLIDPERVRRSRTFYEFDRWVTAPVHGFRDELEYYADSSCLRFIPRIRVPALLINSRDDPIVPPHTYPQSEVEESPWLRGMFVSHGGHAGFVEGKNPFAPEYWAEKCAVSFLAACLNMRA